MVQTTVTKKAIVEGVTPDGSGTVKLGSDSTFGTPFSIWASNTSALVVTLPSICLCTEIHMHRNGYHNEKKTAPLPRPIGWTVQACSPQCDPIHPSHSPVQWMPDWRPSPLPPCSIYMCSGSHDRCFVQV